MIPYRFLSVVETVPPDSYWDMALIKDIFKDGRFTEEPGDGAIVVLPGKNQGKYVRKINEELQKLEWVVLIITSDEERNFPVEKIKHPNIKIWIQNPKQGRHDEYGKWPLGYTSETRKHLTLPDKVYDYFFSGQVTHERRLELSASLSSMFMGTNLLTCDVNTTEGFTQGYEPAIYMERMCQSKVAPAPSGPICAESFRLYEALEAGAIPIGDNISATGDHDYWHYLFPDAPFPTIDNYKDLPGYINDQLDNFQAKANHIQAWWIKKKRDLKHNLIDDVAELSGQKHNEAVTVVIPVSPIKSHPSTEILDETVATIRKHLNVEILITFDGVRQEQEDRRENYEEFIRRALFKCNTEWNAVPIIFDEHMHQSGMMQAVIDEIKSPLLMYVEQDAPLTPDRKIDFQGISTAILNGAVSLVRLSHEALILEPHKHLMLDEKPIDIGGVPLVRTIQYSQRPHVASVAFYRQLLSHFSDDSKAFLEDKLHSVVQTAFQQDGRLGWQNYRLAIYHPEGDIKRSYHSDGRAGESKFDDRQTF